MTNANRTVQFKIYRYDPDTDAKPTMQTIEVELDGSERMLLDALIKLKSIDPAIIYFKDVVTTYPNTKAARLSWLRLHELYTKIRWKEDASWARPRW